MGAGKHAGLEEWKEQLKIFIWTEHTIRGDRSFYQATAGKIRKEPVKNHGFFFAAVSDKEYETMAKELCEGLDWCGIGVVHMNSDRGCQQNGFHRF